jgi:quinol monooxygenase YgiN
VADTAGRGWPGYDQGVEYALINKLTAQPRKRDRVVELLLESGQLFNGNEACLLYLVTVDANDSNVVWVVDLWKSKKAHTQALADPALRPYVEEATPLLEGMPEQIEVKSKGYVAALNGTLGS